MHFNAGALALHPLIQCLEGTAVLFALLYRRTAKCKRELAASLDHPVRVDQDDRFLVDGKKR